MAPPIAPAFGWASMHSDPKWVIPRLDLPISPPRPEGDQGEDNATADGGWAPLDLSTHPSLGWSSDDKDPPPSIGTALAA